MKSFEEVLNSGLINLNEIENYRQEQILIEKTKLRNGLIISGSVFVTIVIIALILEIIPLIAFAFFVDLIAFLVWWANVKKQYVSSIKENLIRELIKSIDENFGYQPNAFIPKDVFKLSNFAKGFNSYTGEDYFFGRIDDIPLEFSQLVVQQKSKNSSVTLFNGVFIAVDFKQPFEGRTVVVPDTMEKTFGALGRLFQNLTIFRDTLIKINDVDFERHFAVYSNNEVEAHKTISGSLLNYLMQLRSESPSGVFFSYNLQKFYLGLFNRQDLFKVDIKNPITENIVSSYYDEIVNNLNIVLNIYSYLEENIVKNSNIIPNGF
jgi:hypothetical protein